MATTWQNIETARERISPFLHHTPVMTSGRLDALTGAHLFFKCENLQKTGSFKVRGAFNAVYSMDEDQVSRGLLTHSAGNHGAAVASAAASRGVPSWVVMPDNAPVPKKAAVAGYGATVVECPPVVAERERIAADLLAETGATFLHPYDDDLVIAGQATTACELIEEAGELDIVLCPVGGGGLLAGTALAVDRLLPDAITYAAEPKGADDAKRSFDAGHIIPQTGPETMADGLLTSVGERNFAVMRDKVQDVLTVSEGGIEKAMRLVWTRLKQVIEPSAAVALAAILEYPDLFAGKRVGLILTGGNVDLDRLPWAK